MFHSILVQDIYNQFYLSYSMNFRDTFCKGFTWDPIQKELHIGFYFGPGSSWMLLEIILNFTWDPVQKELYFRWVIQMNLALDSCQWTLLENNFIEGCWGWSWDHLQRTLSENCSHDLLANAILQEQQCFLSGSKKASWISDALLMHFWCAFWLHSTNLIGDCIQWTLLETDCMLFFLVWSKKVTFQTNFL